MRSAASIKRNLKVVESVWKDFPELRLTQLIANACQGKDESQVFYMADEVLVENLKDYAKQHKRPEGFVKYGKKSGK